MEKNLSKQIIDRVGGLQNILDVSLDGSRIAIKVVNDEAVEMEELKRLESVYGVVNASDEVELIIGKKVSFQVYTQLDQEIKPMSPKNTHQNEKEKRKMFDKLFSKFQTFGKSIMLPISVLPAAGLLLGIGGAFSNPATIENYPFLDVSWLQALFVIMSSAGQIVFSNLPIIFAIGIAVGLAKPADASGSKLKVTFLPSWIRWVPVGRADYWVLARDADYKTALVGTPDKEYLWLLARSPNVSQETYAKYRQIAQKQGYDLKEFKLTPQTNQTVKLVP